MRAFRSALLPVSVAVLLWAAWVVPLPLFVERPGELLSLGEHVEVDVEPPADLEGDFLLTVANLRRATTAEVVLGLLDPAASFIAEQRLIPPGVDDETYFARQRDLFRETSDVAAAVGLRAAGYPVDPTAVIGEGAFVLRAVPGLPADGILQAGDVIVEAGGTTVGTAQDLGDAVAGSDGPLSVVYLREGQRAAATVRPEVRTVAGRARPVIGVEIQTHNPRVELPVAVRVSSGRIGGPSAGLLLALTVYDKAAHDVDLSGGRRVAGTGGLSPDGLVEPVGGVGAKVAAAHESGADVFLVPSNQHDVARAALPAGSTLRIVAVSTFDEAVEALRGRTATLSLRAADIAGRASVRSRATSHREPGQGRKAAAISGSRRAPRGSRAEPSARRCRRRISNSLGSP